MKQPVAWSSQAIEVLPAARVGLWGALLLSIAAIAGFRDGFFGSVRYVYNTLTLVAPMGMLGLAVWIAAQRRLRSGRRYPLRPLLLAAVLLLLLRYYASVYEPANLKLRHVRVVSSRVKQPVRILHISDIQVFRFGAYEQQALAIMARLRPDVVLHSGDLAQPAELDHTHGIVQQISAGLAAIRAPLGVFGVGGDVDWRLDQTGVTDAQLSPMRMLNNRAVCVSNSTARLDVLGLDLSASRSPATAALLASQWLAAGPQGLRIVLGHSPDYVMGLGNHDVDICLAGHTHGGQIRLPFIGPLLTMTSHIPRSYALGPRMLGRTLLNVSGGIGSEHAGRVPPIRFLCPPEMTLITVVPELDEKPPCRQSLQSP